MSWSGGTYTKGNSGTGGWSGDAAAGVGIEAGRHDTQDNDFASGINNTIAKDGQNTPTNNLPMGGYKHTGVALGTARDQYAVVSQSQDSTLLWGGTSSGTATAYTITLTPAITAYATGQRFLFVAHTSNTGTATLNVNGVGAKSIFLASNNTSAGIGYIRANQLCEVVYDGTQFQLMQSSAELQSNSATYLGQSSGTANAIVLTPTVPITNSGYSGLFGLYCFIKDASTNTGACTINVSGLGAVSLVDREGIALKAGMLQSARLYNIYFNGATAYVLNPSISYVAFTPTLTQSGSVAFTNTYCKYVAESNRVTYQGNITATAAGTAGNAITLTLPVTGVGAVGGFKTIGSATFYDASANQQYVLQVVQATTTTITFSSDATAAGGYFGNTPSLALANADQLSWTCTYEV